MTAKAQPIGPYSAFVRSGGFVFCSGQVPVDPGNGELVNGDISIQTRQVLENLRSVLVSAGLGLENVLRTTVYLHSIADLAEMNHVYSAILGEFKPARSTVGGLDLPRGALVEIDAIAAEVNAG
jgi:2-iminobutanoate/2-iminopropanoate deaminase